LLMLLSCRHTARQRDQTHGWGDPADAHWPLLAFPGLATESRREEIPFVAVIRPGFGKDRPIAANVYSSALISHWCVKRKPG